MIVMEYLSKEDCWIRMTSFDDRQTVLPLVERKLWEAQAIDVDGMGGRGVLGDCRDQNVMLQCELRLFFTQNIWEASSSCLFSTRALRRFCVKKSLSTKELLCFVDSVASDHCRSTVVIGRHTGLSHESCGFFARLKSASNGAIGLRWLWLLLDGCVCGTQIATVSALATSLWSCSAGRKGSLQSRMGPSAKDVVDVRFIDFDWAGVAGVQRYPPFMNMQQVRWPQGAETGKLIRLVDDMCFLRSGGIFR